MGVFGDPMIVDDNGRREESSADSPSAFGAAFLWIYTREHLLIIAVALCFFGMLANIMIAVSPLVWLKREIWEAKSNLIRSNTLALSFSALLFVLVLLLPD